MVVETNEMENQLFLWVLELFSSCPASFSLSLSIHPGSNYHQLEPLNPSSLDIAKTSVRMHLCKLQMAPKQNNFFPHFSCYTLYLSALPTLKNGKNDSDQKILAQWSIRIYLSLGHIPGPITSGLILNCIFIASLLNRWIQSPKIKDKNICICA